MIYIVLNILATLFLFFYTKLIDKRLRADSFSSNSFIVSLLLVTVESIGYSLVLIFNKVWFGSLTFQLMRILFVIDGFFFITLSFAIMEIAINVRKPIIQLIKYALLVFVIYIVYFHYSSIEISVEKGIMIIDEYLFKEPVRNFFPWTWATLYQAVIKVFLPTISLLFLCLMQEDKDASQLQKYQSILIGESLLVLWGTSLLVTFVSKVAPGFSLLFVYSYIFMFVLLFTALLKTTVPSGRGLAVSILKVIVTYFIPAAAAGAICAFLQPVGGVNTSFVMLVVLVAVVGVFFSFKISDILSSSSKLYTADYEAQLEKDLASVDYSGEMDAVTNRMNEVIKRNIESTSMSVYIDNGHGALDVAYSSNNMTNSIAINNPIFDVLLNANKTVVIYNEIEKEHTVSSIQDELYKFFEETKSDALFLLNEGHNLLGVITLGRKAGGDHYKEYDYNVFVKLYSYFFVFGYYMRNISNKEIISVVNRELRMSSQIITSIQENIDRLNNPKVDIGYLMVPAHNIGGEFVDLIRLTDTRHLFVVGDLSGKGIAASMNMVILKSIIRSYLSETHDFKELVVKINTFIRDSLRKGTIFAGLFALIDFETDTMYYINCGVPALLLYTQVYNNVIEIQGSGHILGFVKDIGPYISVKTTKLNRGDIILACTDGLIQSHSLRGEQFGKERVQQAVLDNSTYPAQRMAQFTFDGLLKFMSKEMEDDVSILVIKYGNTQDNVEETDDKETGNAETTTEESSAEVTDDTVNAAEESSEVAGDVSAVVDDNVSAEAAVENTDSFAETSSESVVSEPQVDSVLENPAPDQTEEIDVAKAVEEAKEAKEAEASNEVSEKAPLDDGLPEGFDLDNIDAMMKMAGL